MGVDEFLVHMLSVHRAALLVGALGYIAFLYLIIVTLGFAAPGA